MDILGCAAFTSSCGKLLERIHSDHDECDDRYSLGVEEGIEKAEQVIVTSNLCYYIRQ